MFFKKKSDFSMSLAHKKSLDKRAIKYAVSRSSEDYIETKLGENGAINIVDNEFMLVCSGKNIIRADLAAVDISELMNLSGITIRGINLDTGEKMNVTAYFSDGTVRVK